MNDTAMTKSINSVKSRECPAAADAAHDRPHSARAKQSQQPQPGRLPSQTRQSQAALPVQRAAAGRKPLFRSQGTV